MQTVNDQGQEMFQCTLQDIDPSLEEWQRREQAYKEEWETYLYFHPEDQPLFEEV
ncbi:MAG: hypothetical protein NVSMB52_03670 [Chloroflexota bacterium]